MYASSRGKVPPMVRNTIAISNLIVTVCFGMRVVSGNIVDPSETFAQDHFIGLVRLVQRIRHRRVVIT
jgi:hypothetical protein